MRANKPGYFLRFVSCILLVGMLLPSLIVGQQNTPRPLPPAHTYTVPDYHQQNILLNLRFDFEHEIAMGTATITFTPRVKDLSKIELDAGSMTINSVKLSSGAALKFNNDDQNSKLTVDLDRAYQPSTSITIVIDYRTNGPAANRSVNGGGGLTFVKPTPDDPNAPKQIWSQGESEFNHYWFPCYDHPNDFTTTEVIATVEKPLSVISNGKLISVKENSDNTRTYDWKIDVPHATYLTSIVVGEYAAIEQNFDGIPVTTYVYPNQVTEGKVTAARMADMVRFFSEKTGVKYPYSKYAQTMTHNFNGGMENISATTMYDLMIHDARSDIDGTADSLESHELAHQWFGDYVTCKAWSDIWLNESFATYFQAMWDEHFVGNDDFLYSDVKGNQDQYFQAWRRGQRRPIVTSNYFTPEAMFDTYAYPRGGAVLHMLRKTLGDDNWWKSINHYLTKNAHQPVDTEQFRKAIEETTGQSMSWFFDEWVYKMGHPVFTVTQSYDASAKKVTLKVRQDQKPDSSSAYPQAGLFKMPVEIEIGNAAGTHIEHVMIEPKEEQTFTFESDTEPLLVNFDYGSTIIKELNFDKTLPQLTYQLAHDKDPLGRISALNALAVKLKASGTEPAEKETITKAITTAITGDKFWAVRRDSIGVLSGSKDPAVKTALLTASKDEKSAVRSRAISALSLTSDPSLSNVYLQSLNDQSYSVVRAAAVALGETKDAAAYDALNKLTSQESWRDNLRFAGLSGLAALGDVRALDWGLKYAQRGYPNAVRISSLQILALGKNDPRVYPAVAVAFEQAFTGIYFQVAITAGQTLIALGDPRGLDLIKSTREKIRNPQMDNILNQVENSLKDKIKANEGKN